MAPRVIDEDLAHDPRGDAEEVRAVLPLNPGLVHEPEERFAHKRRRLERVSGPLAAHQTAGEPSELRVERLGQPVSPR